MGGYIQFIDKGGYFFLKTVGEVQGKDFVDMFLHLFAQKENVEQVKILIDLEDHPNVVGLPEFSVILNDADAQKISNLEINIISQDPRRFIVGEMLEAHSESFQVNLTMNFFTTCVIAEKELAKQSV